jgi:hypothetical protein
VGEGWIGFADRGIILWQHPSPSGVAVTVLHGLAIRQSPCPARDLEGIVDSSPSQHSFIFNSCPTAILKRKRSLPDL